MFVKKIQLTLKPHVNLLFEWSCEITFSKRLITITIGCDSWIVSDYSLVLSYHFGMLSFFVYFKSVKEQMLLSFVLFICLLVDDPPLGNGLNPSFWLRAIVHDFKTMDYSSIFVLAFFSFLIFIIKCQVFSVFCWHI